MLAEHLNLSKEVVLVLTVQDAELLATYKGSY